MKKVILSLVLVPSLCWGNIYSLNSENVHFPSLKLSSEIKKNPGNFGFGLEGEFVPFEDLTNFIKRPKHTSLNDELRKEYQENFQTLKKCYIKPKDNLSDIMTVMGKFINAYADIVYGKELISYKQEVQDYDRILSNTPLNKGVDPELCKKAREFFESQLM